MAGARAKRQLLGVQALRGLAATLVVIAHLIEHGLGDAAPNAAALSGRFGVEIFFVVSGFVIQYSAGDRAIDPAAFAIRRFARIVPLYWGTTLLVGALGIVAPQVYKTTVFALPSLIKSILFIPYEYPVGSDDWRPLFKLGWTLNYEMFFYATMLCLFWCGTARRRAIGLTIVMGALIAGSMIPRDPRSVASFLVNLNVMPFLMGVWIAEGWRAGLFARWKQLHFAAVPLAVVLVALFYRLPMADLPQRGPHLVMIAAAVSLLIAALALEREGGDVPALLWIGDISYSIYLLHMFIVGAIWAVAHRVAHGQPGIPMLAGIMIAGLALTLVLSGLSYRWFEMPINRAGGRLVKRIERRRAAGGDALSAGAAAAAENG